MRRDEIEFQVLDVLKAALKMPVDAGLQRSAAPTWDSLKHVEIVFALEDVLGLEFSPDEMGSLDSAQRIIDVAVARHAA